MIGKSASGLRRREHVLPRLQFKIIYLWLECKRSNPHALAACPAASVHVLEQGGRKFALFLCLVELPGRHLPAAPPRVSAWCQLCSPAQCASLGIPLLHGLLGHTGEGSGQQRCANPHLFQSKTQSLIAFSARLYSGQLSVL